MGKGIPWTTLETWSHAPLEKSSKILCKLNPVKPFKQSLESFMA